MVINFCIPESRFFKCFLLASSITPCCVSFVVNCNILACVFNCVVKKFDNDSKISNVEEILLKENQNLKHKYANTLNKLEKILVKINKLEKKGK